MNNQHVDSSSQADISVYIHIPFHIKDRRGDSALTVPSTRDKRNAYLDALDRELMAAGDVLNDRRIVSIHIGGGIATVVSPDRLARMVLKFRRTYPVAPDVELTVTAAPQTMVTPCLTSLNMCNITRISLAAFTPIDQLLGTIDASHNLNDIENATFVLGKFGYPNMDVVLMYGIPGQTLTAIRNTIIAFTALKGFKHVTLQRYELAEQSGVSAVECEEQYLYAKEILAEKGYPPYAAACFAKPGWESLFIRHELQGVDRVGFGLGAKSYIGDLIYQNTTNFDSYLRDSADFTKVITDSRVMDKLDRMKRFVALRLQTVEGFSEEEFCREFGNNPNEAITFALQPLKDSGLVCSQDGRVQCTERGLMRSDDVVKTVTGG